VDSRTTKLIKKLRIGKEVAKTQIPSDTVPPNPYGLPKKKKYTEQNMLLQSTTDETGNLLAKYVAG
jgi:hypothetical protein